MHLRSSDSESPPSGCRRRPARRRAIVALLGLVVALPALAASKAPPPPSALADLQRRNPRAVATLDRVQRAVMSQLTWLQLEELRAGRDPRKIEIVGGWTLADYLHDVLAVDGFSIPFFTIDGGSDVSVGGTFEVVGSVGQPDAGIVAGDGFYLSGGYWGPAGLPPLLADDFESGTAAAWASFVSTP